MNYQEIKNHCETTSRLSQDVVDEFLLYYAAEKERIELQFDVLFKKYRKVLKEIPENYLNYLKSEFIAHRVFRKEGYITKYLHRTEIKNLPQEQFNFLKSQSLNPWRFSISEISGRPAHAFFEMEDVFTGEQYLLYSPGMEATEEEEHPRLWFNLIAYNGLCWQTFGLIIPFKSFTSDDLFFFATELNPEIANDEMLMNEVENNPFPFFMLLCSSNLPVVVSRGHELVTYQATDIVETYPTLDGSLDFMTEWNKNVYRITSKKMGEFPHYAIAYYNEQNKELTRTSMTEAGFEGLTRQLAKAGFDLNPDADILVAPGMITAAEKILDKKITVNPYDKLFSKKKDEAESEKLKSINRFLNLVLPFYNANKVPDIKQLAHQAGISEETAAQVWASVKKSSDEMRNKI